MSRRTDRRPIATSSTLWHDPMSNSSNKLRPVAAVAMRRPNRYWLIAALVAALLYYGWSQVTQPRGDQVVAFRPAAQRCGSDGPLRYCIYRDRRGTNGDVLYHLHGRNLDERIWNDDTYLTAMVQAEWQRSAALPPTVVELSYGPSWLLTYPRGVRLLSPAMA